jgi:hypothetical protein
VDPSRAIIDVSEMTIQPTLFVEPVYVVATQHRDVGRNFLCLAPRAVDLGYHILIEVHGVLPEARHVKHVSITNGGVHVVGRIRSDMLFCGWYDVAVDVVIPVHIVPTETARKLVSAVVSVLSTKWAFHKKQTSLPSSTANVVTVMFVSAEHSFQTKRAYLVSFVVTKAHPLREHSLFACAFLGLCNLGVSVL